MVKAFGAEQDVELGGFPQAQSNIPVHNSIRASALGEAFSGLGDLAKTLGPIFRDRAMGEDIASMREALQVEATKGNMPELQLKKDKFKSIALRKYGAEKFALVQRGLSDFDDLTTIVDAQGNKVVVGPKGDVRGRSAPKSVEELDAQMFGDDVASIAVNLPETAKRSEGLINLIKGIQESNPNAYNLMDGPRIMNIASELATVPEQIDRIHRKYLNDNKSFSSLAEKQDMDKRSKAEIMNLIYSKLDTFDSPWLRNVLRNSNGVVTHQMIAEMPRAFVNDVMNQMQEQGVFTSMGLERKDIEKGLDERVDSYSKFYSEVLKSETEELAVAYNTKNLRNEIQMSDELAKAMRDPDIARLMAVGQRLTAVAQTLTVSNEMAFQTGSVDSRRIGRALHELITGQEVDRQRSSILAEYDRKLNSESATASDAANYLALWRDIIAKPDGSVNQFMIDRAVLEVKSNEASLLKALGPDGKAELKKYRADLENLQRKLQIVQKKHGVTPESIEESKGLLDALGDFFRNKNTSRRRPE